jgi:gamma-butyrobetaine dioxygenase
LSGERLLYTADIPDDLRVVDAFICNVGHLNIDWSDGHRSIFVQNWLAEYDYSTSSHQHRTDQPSLWGRSVRLPEFDHGALMASTAILLEYLDAVHAYGAAIVKNTPPIDGEVVRFAKEIGVIRTVAFGMVHDVLNSPDGYNVAHTALELKPHSDLASYTWPPSFQLLHYLLNAVTGGETILVDGWNVLAVLKQDDPEGYDLLASVPVPFKIFSITHDTYAEEPIIQLHPDGRIRVFRFSNQTAQPLQIHPELVEPFYKAYKRLGQLISDDRFRVKIKAQSGDMLTIHNHRVLHGRLAYDSSSGNRHLQDLYMEWDDVMAKRRVLRGHIPIKAWPEK